MVATWVLSNKLRRSLLAWSSSSTLRAELRVDGLQLLVDRLDLLLRGLQLFIGGLQLLVGGFQLLQRRVVFFHGRLQLLARVAQLALELSVGAVLRSGALATALRGCIGADIGEHHHEQPFRSRACSGSTLSVIVLARPIRSRSSTRRRSTGWPVVQQPCAARRAIPAAGRAAPSATTSRVGMPGAGSRYRPVRLEKCSTVAFGIDHDEGRRVALQDAVLGSLRDAGPAGHDIRAGAAPAPATCRRGIAKRRHVQRRGRRIAALEDAVLLVDQREQLAMPRHHLRAAQQQIAVRHQAHNGMPE